jgi:hypothetical protein
MPGPESMPGYHLLSEQMDRINRSMGSFSSLNSGKSSAQIILSSVHELLIGPATLKEQPTRLDPIG